MDECFNFAVNQHSHKRMVGTRQVFSEEDEIQPNGKVFKKWVMGSYKWKTYLQVKLQGQAFTVVNFTKFYRVVFRNYVHPFTNCCVIFV